MIGDAVTQIMGALAAWAILAVAAIVTVAALAAVIAQRWARGLWRGTAIAWALAGAALALGVMAWLVYRLALLVGRLGRRAYARGCQLSRPNEHGGLSLRGVGGQPAGGASPPPSTAGLRRRAFGGRSPVFRPRRGGPYPAPERWNAHACRRHAMAPARCLGRARPGAPWLRLRWWQCRRCVLCGLWEHRRTCPWREGA